MIVIDFEVFRYDWLCVLFDIEKTEEQVFINDPDGLKYYFNNNQERIYIGYNINGYDQYIFKAILLDIDPYKVSQWIINGNYGYRYTSMFRMIDVYFYDVQTTTHSLKELEGFLGMSIKESNVSFDLCRKLSQHEINESVEYCRYDVYATTRVFGCRIDEFKTHLALIKEFKLNKKHISKKQSKLIEIILKAKRVNREDDFDLIIPKNLTLEHNEILDFFMTNTDYSKQLECKLFGVNHVFAYGGLHGAIPNYIDDGLFIMLDVESYYPSMMILYDLMSRNVKDVQDYKDIYYTRLKLKAILDSKELIYKLILNKTYGCMKYKFSALYDPRMANNICFSGQIFLVDLIERLCSKGCVKLVQSNTDGILIKVESYAVDVVKQIAKKWCDRTGFKLSFKYYNRVIQKDVNNYILVGDKGIKTKGGYVKSLDDLTYDFEIVNRAIVNYFVNDVDVETTVYSEKYLKPFQKVSKITRKFDSIYHGNDVLNEKCIRYFASKCNWDSGLYKSKNGVLHKISGSPEHAYIDNTDINDKKISRKLDREWYIDVAKKRISDFVSM